MLKRLFYKLLRPIIEHLFRCRFILVGSKIKFLEFPYRGTLKRDFAEAYMEHYLKTKVMVSPIMGGDFSYYQPDIRPMRWTREDA